MTVGRVHVVALCVAVFGVPAAALADEHTLGLLVEAGVTTDDNVTRSRGDDRLSDTSYDVRLTWTRAFPRSMHTRLLLSGIAGAERFSSYAGLSHAFVGVQGEFQYRESGAFLAPTFGIFGRAVAEAYDSRLRDGYRYSVGGRILQPLTDRLNLSVALAYNARDGRSRVFDGHDYAARANLDYAVSARSTLYLGGEYRRGHLVSTARPSLYYVDIAEASIQDDAFPDSGRLAYRVRARTGIATLGYNLGLSENQSLDFSLRSLRSTALENPGFPGAGTIRYQDTLGSIVYLVRF
jgi:hypothetical protein